MRKDASHLAPRKGYPLILLLRRPILLLDGVLKLRVGPVEENLGTLADDQQALHLGPPFSLTRPVVSPLTHGPGTGRSGEFLQNKQKDTWVGSLFSEERRLRTSAGRGVKFRGVNCANLVSCSQISLDCLSKQSLLRGYTIIARL